MFSSRFALAALSILLIAGFQARAVTLCTAGNANTTSVPESTPSNAFVSNNDGTVTHSLTGLMWKQCAQGLSGTGCAGTAAAMTWRTALAAAVTDTTAGHTDWRLPNSKELESIVEFCGNSPAINRTLFPATPSGFFWSGSSSVLSPSRAFDVNFANGNVDALAKTNNFYVRLVRGGQASDSFDVAGRLVVVEYLNVADFPNSPGGHFFYSSEAAEQAAVDAGAAGAFVRTGRQFLIGGNTPVCRFYGSVTPGPNSHFFTVDVNECDALKAAQLSPRPADAQQWNFEGVSYATTPVNVFSNGTRSCTTNTLPLYRAYNNAFPLIGPKNPWDSNHRFTPQLTDIADMVAKGWRDEGIVFCSAQ